MPLLSLGKPYIEEHDALAYLKCDVTESCNSGTSHFTLWASVSVEYGKYFDTSVCDPFVVAVLPYCMLNGYDIECDSMSEELCYNITSHLVPAFSTAFENVHPVLILSRTLEMLPPVGEQRAVGTGVSMGVDSFDAIMTGLYEVGQSHIFKLSSLVVSNVGAFGDFAECIPLSVKKTTKQIGDELGLPVIFIESNIHLWHRMHHLTTHTFRNVFAVLCLSRYFETYYYSSAGHSNKFYDMATSWKLGSDVGDLDLFLLPLLSTSRTRFYSAGYYKTRLEKMEHISGFEITYRYLNSCLGNSNCGKCFKCIRNILTLDAIGKLDLYSGQINLDYWNKHHDELLLELIHDKDTEYYRDVFPRYLSKKGFDECLRRYSNIESKFSDYKDPFYAYMVLNHKSKSHAFKLASLYSGGAHSSNLDSEIYILEKCYELDPKCRLLYLDALLYRASTDDCSRTLAIISEFPNDPECIGRLGRMYRDGKGVEKDLNKAAELMLRAVEMHKGWTNECADVLLRTNSPENWKKAFEMCSSICDRNIGAIGRLGRMYRDGKGVEKDLNKAAELFLMVARKDARWINECIDILVETRNPNCFQKAYELCSLVKNNNPSAMERLRRKAGAMFEREMK